MAVEMKAPKRTLAFYNRLGTWVALLFISLGLSMQSVQVNLFEQASLDKEYAHAMAQQMAYSLRTKLSETQMQQKNAARHEQTITYLDQEDLSWKRTLKSLINGAEQIFILDNMSALGLKNKLGYAVQELVTKTLKGKEFPLEAVQLNGDIHFYLATPIRDYSQTVKGVLLIEYGSDWLDQLRQGAAAKHGLISTRQVLKDDPSKGLQVFEIGKRSASRLTVVTESINDYWFLTFIPADTRPQLATTSIVTPWIFALLSTLITLLLITWLQKREVDYNQLMLLNYIRQLFRKGENISPNFSIEVFHDIGKAMAHLAHSKGIISHDEGNHQSKIKREKQNIELTQTPNKAPKIRSIPSRSNTAIPRAMVEKVNHDNVTQSIFRAYDIRGTFEDNLTPNVAEQIGLALGSELLIRGESKVVLGWDGRLSSPEFAFALQKGLLATGCNVVNIGSVVTGMMYYACYELDSTNGVMVTGSHNAANYNGFKIVIDRKTLSKKSLMALYHRIQRKDFRTGQGLVEEKNISRDYLERIQSDIQLSRPLKVVFDAGNGIAGPIGLQLLKTMGLDVVPLFCDVDGNFPNHNPNPSDPKNLIALQKAVVDHRADLGIAVDGDGDRIGLVDERGMIIMADRILMFLAKDIISRQPGCDVVYDIKSSRRLNQLISQFGGRPTMWKTGHSLMKAKMEELQATLGGELSGHIYFRDRWYGFDDSLYVSARLLELFSHQMDSVSQIFAEFPDDVSTAEITINTDDVSKFSIIQKLASEPTLQQDARVSTIDGIRSDFHDGWGLIRASNTSPKLTLRFAGDDSAALQRIQLLYKNALLRHAPELQIPF
ncbi:MAG: phosphomannomutase/phosphoglucomutase [Oleispira sp.]|jgi:phosphomannomutase/phosphoglucomutase